MCQGPNWISFKAVEYHGMTVSCLNLHHSNVIWCRASFQMLICHLYISFGELCPDLLPTFLLFCVWILIVLSMFWIPVIIQLSLLHIFSPIYGLSSHSFKLCTFLNYVVFVLLSCGSSLYILGASPLWGIWFANTFSPSVLSFCFI